MSLNRRQRRALGGRFRTREAWAPLETRRRRWYRFLLELLRGLYRQHGPRERPSSPFVGRWREQPPPLVGYGAAMLTAELVRWQRLIYGFLPLNLLPIVARMLRDPRARPMLAGALRTRGLRGRVAVAALLVLVPALALALVPALGHGVAAGATGGMGIRVEESPTATGPGVPAAVPFTRIMVGQDGVIGNGVADDTTKINAILATADYVLIGPGTYKISAALNPGSNTYVLASRFARFTLPAATNTAMLQFSNLVNSVWVGGEFDATNQVTAARVVLFTGTTTNCEIQGAYIHDGVQNGIELLSTPSDVDIVECRIENNGQRSGVGGSDMHGIKSQATRVNVRDNYIIGNGYKRAYGDAQPSNTSGIKLLGSGTDWDVSRNRIRLNGGKGIEVTSTFGAINGNIVQLNEEVGIFLNTCTGVVVTANRVWGNLNNGIDSNNGNECQLVANRCYFNGSSRNATGQNQEGSGIFLNCVRDFVVVGNYCRSNSQGQHSDAPAFGGDGRSGIRLTDTGAAPNNNNQGVTIQGNRCHDARVSDGWTATLNGAIGASDQTLRFTNVSGSVPTDGPFTFMIDFGGANPEIVIGRSVSGSTITVWRAENNTNGVAHANGVAINLRQTQKYGIDQKGNAAFGSDNYLISGNDVRGNLVAGFRENNATRASTRRWVNNPGITVRAKGSGSVASGTTTVTVNFATALERTPTKDDCRLVLTNSPTNNVFGSVTAVSTSSITVGTRSDPGASGLAFSFEVLVDD